MRLTRKKAIELCIELWKWLAETGEEKRDWPGWEKYGDIQDDCWFCEYGYQRHQANKMKIVSICIYCPYYKAIGAKCFHSFYDAWTGANSLRTRKKYAKLFLEQIRQCK